MTIEFSFASNEYLLTCKVGCKEAARLCLYKSTVTLFLLYNHSQNKKDVKTNETGITIHIVCNTLSYHNMLLNTITRRSFKPKYPK